MDPNFIIYNVPYKVWKFPSGEVQVALLRDIDEDNDYMIHGSITCSDHIMELLQLVDVLRFNGATNISLHMPYCAYSRQDRRNGNLEASSLKIFTDLIASCNFKGIYTLDNHSYTSTTLLNAHDYSVQHWLLQIEADYLIIPDAGAIKRVTALAELRQIPTIRADKQRDSTGKITETIVYATSEQLKDKTVLIVDDICQGGKTFEELAKAIKAIEPSTTIHLAVTHGFFSSGFEALREAGISKFITTNSVYSHNNRSNTSDVKVIDVIFN